MMRRRLAVHLITSVVILGVAASIVGVPMHPDLLEKLKAEERLAEVVERLESARQKGVFAPNPNPPRAGTMAAPLDQPAIVILADFSDNPADTLAFPVVHFDSLLFSDSIYPTGSLHDYYIENSYGSTNITGQVTVWVRMPEPYTYYTDGDYGFGSYPHNAQKLTEDAVTAADPLVNFKDFDADNDGFVDALFVVHAGPGAEVTGDPWDIWSHAWRTSYPIPVDEVLVRRYSMEPEDGRIGVFCHELGHVFGLPDLYDYGYDSDGLGGWTLMAGGCWGNGGRTPVHFDGWCKSKLGYFIPVELSPGIYDSVEFPLVEYSPVAYKLYGDNQPVHEYYIVENRSNVGFDLYIPGPGLCVYHCDDTVSTGNDLQWYPGYTDFGHYLVAMEQADGEWDMERNYGSDAADPYPGVFANRTFNDTTVPDTKTYSFLSTGVCVDNVSDAGDTMTATLCAGPGIGVSEDRAYPGGRQSPSAAIHAAPNPFRGSVTLRYHVSSVTDASLEIFDMTGGLVAALAARPTGYGECEVRWDASGRPSGVYFAVLRSGDHRTTKKLMLVD
jgi:immune inhibitor A